MRLRIRGRRRPDVRRFDGGENVDHKVKFSDDPSAIPRAPTISPLPHFSSPGLVGGNRRGDIENKRNLYLYM